MNQYAILVLRFGTLTGDISSVISVIKIPVSIFISMTFKTYILRGEIYGRQKRYKMGSSRYRGHSK